jgi:hypothetical protein
MRLQAVAVPNAGDRHMTHPQLSAQGARAPMRRIGRCRLERGVHDFLDQRIFQALTAGLARGFMFQSSDSGRSKPITPQQDSGPGGAQLASNLPIAMTFMSQQANAGP